MRIYIMMYLILFVSLPSLSEGSVYDDEFFTLTRVYGVIKYYNNLKNDHYLDEELIEILPKLRDPQYSIEQYNLDLKNLIQLDQNSSKSNSFLIDPNSLAENKKSKCTINFSWIEDNELLSKENKQRLVQLIRDHQKISNSNIKRKRVYIHNENDLNKSISGNNLYLLGIIKFWNVIEYFFPYKPIMDEDWSKTLKNSISDIKQIESNEDYLIMLKRLSSKLNDSHASVEDKSRNNYNVFKLPFSIKVLEGQLVIQSINDSLSNVYSIKTGDIIIEIDGKTYKDLWREFSDQYSYSNNQGGLSDFKIFLWHKFNSNDSIVEARIKSDSYVHAEIIKTISLDDYRKYNKQTEVNSKNYYSVNDDIGYIDYTNITYSKIGKAFRANKNKEYLIIDFRGYNYGFSSIRFLNFLGNRKKPFAKYYQANYHFPGNFDNPKEVRYRVLPKLEKTYRGKIIALINEEAVSAMETLLMAIKVRRPDAVFIGSPTQGCNGEMSLMILPGGQKVWFTGVEWLYPDGSQFQRIGIKPDIYVEPTIHALLKMKILF
jgi:C-terminal processing protease CtpA/Prc